MKKQLVLFVVLLFTFFGYLQALKEQLGQVIQAKSYGVYPYQYDIEQKLPVRIDLTVETDVIGFKFKMDEYSNCIPQYQYCPSYALDTLVFTIVEPPTDLKTIKNGTLYFNYKIGNLNPFLNVDPKRVYFNVTTLDGKTAIPFQRDYSSVLKISYSEFIENNILSLRFSVISKIDPQTTSAKMNELYQVSYPKSFKWTLYGKTLELAFIHPRKEFNFTINSVSLDHLIDAPCMNNKQYVTMAYFGWKSATDAVSISNILMKVTLFNTTKDVFGNQVDIDFSTLSIYRESNYLTNCTTNRVGSSISSDILLSPGDSIRVMAVNKSFKQEIITDPFKSTTTGSMKKGQVLSFRVPLLKVPQLLLSTTIDLKQGNEMDVMVNYYSKDSETICNKDSMYEFKYSINKQGNNTYYTLLEQIVKRELVTTNLFFICKSDSGCTFDFKLGAADPLNSLKPLNDSLLVEVLVPSIIIPVALLTIILTGIIVIFIRRKRVHERLI